MPRSTTLARRMLPAAHRQSSWRLAQLLLAAAPATSAGHLPARRHRSQGEFREIGIAGYGVETSILNFRLRVREPYGRDETGLCVIQDKLTTVKPGDGIDD